MIYRYLDPLLRKYLFKGKLLLVVGARQVGKTTLVKAIGRSFGEKTLFLNCDIPSVQILLTDANPQTLREAFGNKEVIIIDEAQRVRNIGLTLKIIADELPEKQVIATGSSSLELANEINEPLTGRKFEFQMYPIALFELMKNKPRIEIQNMLEERLVFGMYPEIITKPEIRQKNLENMIAGNLYKDVLSYHGVRKPDLIIKFLQALALQMGNEVAYSELASMLSVNKETVERYVDLLEKSYIIFRLPPFSRNLRNELKKMRKIYFYDNGVRNALINNFNPLTLRNDVGVLWENFIISERKKWTDSIELYTNRYFWRSHQKMEVDYLEDYRGTIHAYEIKWNKYKRLPKAFVDSYTPQTAECINKDNFYSFLGV